MANVQSAITVSSFLFVQGQTAHSFSTGNIWCNLFSRNSTHSDCHSFNIYLFVRGFRSENGMSSTEMSPSRASLAAESAAKFPLLPTWPGTQIKTISCHFRIILKSELRSCKQGMCIQIIKVLSVHPRPLPLGWSCSICQVLGRGGIKVLTWQKKFYSNSILNFHSLPPSI